MDELVSRVLCVFPATAFEDDRQVRMIGQTLDLLTATAVIPRTGHASQTELCPTTNPERLRTHAVLGFDDRTLETAPDP